MAPEDRNAPGGEELRRALEMAGSLLGGTGNSGDPSQTEQTAPDLGKLLEAMMSQSSTPPPEDPQPAENPGDLKLGALMQVLPQIMDAMSGNADLVNAERLNLVRAIKPYLPSGQAGSVDRAIRLANMTKAAKNALRLLGR